MLQVIPADNTIDIILTGTITKSPEEFTTQLNHETNTEKTLEIELVSQNHGYTYQIIIQNTCFVNLQSNNEVLIKFKNESTQEQHSVRLPNAFCVTHAGDISDDTQ